MKNLALIERKLLLRAATSLGLFAGLSLLLGQLPWAASAALGTLGSFAAFKLMAKAQEALFATRNPKSFFSYFLGRFAIYSIPLFLAIKFPYFNIAIVLIFLFIFQLHLVGLEVLKNYKGYQQKKAKWNKSDT